jgi:hypothetical protein
MSHMHHLPLATRFFAILVGFFFIVLILRSVRDAYGSLVGLAYFYLQRRIAQLQAGSEIAPSSKCGNPTHVAPGQDWNAGQSQGFCGAGDLTGWGRT